MKKYFIYILASASLLTTACKDYLDLTPGFTIVDENFWETETQLRMAADAIYAKVLNKTTVDMEQMADNTQWYVVNLWTQIGMGIVPNDFSTIEGTWSGHYHGIGECNRFLENYHRAEEVAEGRNEAIAAEVRVLRAYFYYQLVFHFGDVPLITKQPNVDEIYGPRDAKEDVIDFILDDLDVAIAALPDAVPEGDALGRIGKGAALAFKARIALYNERWNVAEKAANELMDLNLYELYTAGGPDNAYRDLFTHKGKLANGANKETIFARLNKKGLSTHNLSREIQVQENCRWNATKSLAEAYLSSDGLPIEISPLYDESDYNSIWENRDPRMEQTLVRPGAEWGGGWDGDPATNDPTIFHVPKFKQNNSKPGSKTITGYYFTKYVDIPEVARVNQDDNDIHLIRLAEVYLTYAEAKMEQGTLTQNDLDISINKLRDRVGMTHMKISDIEGNGLEMRDEIRRERRVELALEGQRYFDILRWKEGYRLGEDMKGIKASWLPVPADVADLPKDENGYIIARTERQFQENKHYLWPIPAIQRQYNPNLTQNPGWEK